MRVALIDPSLFTLPYDAGLARGLRANGAQVSFHGRALKPADGGDGGLDVQDDFYRLVSRLGWLPKPARLLLKGVDHGFSLLRLLRRLRREQPDIIHFQWMPLPLLDAALLDRFRAIAPVVLTVHDTNPFNGDPTARLQRLGVQQMLQKCDRLIVHTRQAVARMTESGIDPNRITVVPHGAFSGEVQTAKVHEDAGVEFVLFGKIKPYKGADLLVDAFARLPEPARSRAKIRIVGQAYMKLDALRQQVAARGVETRVAIEDRFVDDSEMPSVFGPGTIAVFPYREIEASGVLSLAIAYGRPIIATSIGLFPEILTDGVHGGLVPSEDPEALSAAMYRMITEPGFMASCETAVVALSSSVPDWDEVGRITLQLYQRCIVERGGAKTRPKTHTAEGLVS